MDPITAVANLATAILTFAMKVYDDTPKELRDKQAERWSRILDHATDVLTGFKK